MATYFVKNGGSDGAAGTSDATAWATVSKVNGFALAAGDIVQFRGGDTWNETLNPKSGTSGNPITYTSYGTGRANLTGPFGLAANADKRIGGLFWSNSHDWVVDNLQISSDVINYNGGAGAADRFSGCAGDGTSSGTASTRYTIQNCLISNWHIGINTPNWDSFATIQNNTIEDIGGSGVISGRGTTGVAITAGQQTNNNYLNNIIRRTGKGTNPDGDGPFHALYNDSRNSVVRGNTISDFANTGISIRFKGATVENNLIDGSSGGANRGSYGIAWFSYEMASNQGTTLLAYNRITGVGITGIYLSRNAGVSQPDTQENFYLLNNSFDLNTATGGSAYITVEFTSGFLRIHNNSGSSAAARSIDVQYVPSSWDESCNNWYNTSGLKMRYNGTDQTTIAGWQSATGKGSGDIASAPLYVSWALSTSSPNINAGTTSVTGITYIGPDVTGSLYHYSGSAPDIGALEVWSVASPTGGVHPNIREVFGSGITRLVPQPSSQPGDVFPSGVILQYGGSAPPANWLICDGTAVSRGTFSALFSVLGTVYGAGDGSTTFNLPDLRDRVPVGKSGTKALGSTGGASTVTLGLSNLPAHNHGGGVHAHSISDPGHAHSSNTSVEYAQDASSGGGASKGGAIWGTTTPNVRFTNGVIVNPAGTGIGISNSGTIISTEGSNAPHENMPPYLTVNHIIKT
jgi:microcystin-dependent protein